MNRVARFGALAAAALLAACGGGKGGRGGPGARGSAGADSTAASSAAAAPEPDTRDMASKSIPELVPALFAYDSDHLDAAARSILKANAVYLTTHKSIKVRVAGHCDERGTTAYNLALGQRRARAVRDFYRILGIEPSRVATISYGREQPLCEESTDACWARNRRGETQVLISETLAGAALAVP